MIGLTAVTCRATVGTRLSALVALLCGIAIVAGLMGLAGMQRSNRALETVYLDRVVPLQQLKAITDAYDESVIDTINKANVGLLSAEDALQALRVARGRISQEWATYQATYLTADEARLAAEANQLFVIADGEVANMEQVLAAKHGKIAGKLIGLVGPLYTAIGPIHGKVKELSDLQLRVAKAEYDQAQVDYARVRAFNLGLLIVGILLGAFLGYRIVRNLLRQLGCEPGYAAAIAYRVASGDLSTPIALKKGDTDSLLFAMQNMVAQLAQTRTEQEHSEQARRESEALFRKYFDSSLIGMAITSPQKGWIEVNNKFCETLGYSRDELTRLDWTNLTYPDDLAADVRNFERMLAGEIEGYSMEKRYIRKDGQIIHADISVTCLRRANGSVSYVLGLMEDTTARWQAEQALRASEARYRQQTAELEAIYQSAPVGLCVLDTDLRFVRINARLAEINGIPAATHLGKTVREIVPQLADQAEPLMHQVIATGEPVLNIEISGETDALPGVQRSWIAHWLPLKNDDGSIIGINVVAEEITARKRAEAALRASEARFRALFEQAGVGIAELDPESGRLLSCNQKLADIGLYTPQELLGEVFLHFIHSDDQPVAAERFHALIKDEFGEYNLELRGMRKDGEVICMQVNAVMVRMADGQTGRVVCVIQDITDRKHAEQSLQQVNRLLDTVVNSTHLLMAYLDAEFNFIWVNHAYAAADGHEPGFFPGKNHFALYPNDENLAIFHRVAETGTPCFLQAKPFEYKDHPERGVSYWDWRLIPVKNATGKVERLVLTLLDVSTRIRAEEALLEAGRRKDEFLATLAHELRNPLAPISNAFALIKRTSGVPEVVGQALNMGERQVGQLVRLVDDLLDISRITRGKTTLHKAHVNLSDVAQSALETARPPIEAAGHWLTVELPEEPVYLEADLTRLAQAVANLLINAAKFTEPGGRIQLRARCEGDELVIAVQDSGIGIPEAELPKVFELFAQVKQPPGQRRGGLGIGLALVRSLVELHGGRVEAASAGPGQGSTFTIRLPCSPAAPARESSEVVPATESPSAIQPRRILVVDDDADVADSLAMLLKACGHEVATVYNGAAAIAAARTHRPEVVLLDLGMPGMDGLEVARRLRQLPELHATRLIALTGWGQEEYRRRSQAAGFDAHLVKPVHLPTLEALLDGERPDAETRQPTGAA